jgi:site-specific DNA-methyltransferase (adenine-specific)
LTLKPEWLNKIYKHDAIEAMRRLPNNCIHLCVTDPPYIMNKTSGSATSCGMKEKWQGMLKAGDKTANIKNQIEFKDWLPELYRIMKEQSHFYVFVNDKNVQDMLNEATKVGFRLHNILVWKKNNKTPNKYYMKNCEFIIFFRKGKSFYINDKGSSQYQDVDYGELDYVAEDELWEEQVLKINNINGKDKLHPTQKPVELLEKLILNSSKEGDIILDPFMGSGSTAVACINTNRQYIGFEIDEKYIKICNKRIDSINVKSR